jgi:hypothetical protein
MAFLPIISAVAGIAGAGLSAIGAMNTAKSQAQAADYNAKQQDLAAAADAHHACR